MKFVILVMYTAISSVTFSCIIESTVSIHIQFEQYDNVFVHENGLKGEKEMYVLVQWKFCARFQFLEFIEAKFSPSFHFAMQLYLPIPLKKP